MVAPREILGRVSVQPAGGRPFFPVGATVGAVGIETALGLRLRPANAAQRAVQSMASTRPGAWAFSRSITPLDRLVHRATRGRLTLPQVLAGLPVVMVTTTGRKSGEARVAPLVGVPVDGNLAVVGTNFGQPRTPGWVHNLEADPSARVTYRDADVEVRARPATPSERARVLRAAAAIYPGYDRYRERVTGREIRVFVLEPA
jgi:deazaflavin-dependent oxidoreductase (nitroreductase family)